MNLVITPLSNASESFYIVIVSRLQLPLTPRHFKGLEVFLLYRQVVYCHFDIIMTLGQEPRAKSVRKDTNHCIIATSNFDTILTYNIIFEYIINQYM